MNDNVIIYGDPCHVSLVNRTKRQPAFSPTADYNAQRDAIGAKLRELLGLAAIEQNAAPAPDLEIEYEERCEGYTKVRFTFQSEVGTRVPCYLLIPDTGKEKYPVAITLQGHSTGVHNSVGEVKFEGDVEYQATRGKFGIQAVENGYIALCIEQRGMGERVPTTPERQAGLCGFTVNRSLMLGRTILGERVFDVKCAIDLLPRFFPQCDTDKILITGNSGGGTASFYAACYDKRIALSVPSCSFCPYDHSIFDVQHCTCNYIPSAFRYFDMQDLAILIAPRPLAVVAGVKDPGFLVEGVRLGFKTISEIYKAAGAPNACRLVETPKGHYWCVDIMWKTINQEATKLGWK